MLSVIEWELLTVFFIILGDELFLSVTCSGKMGQLVAHAYEDLVSIMVNYSSLNRFSFADIYQNISALKKKVDT